MTLTENMLCAKTHEYVVEVEKGTYQIGLTEYAIDQLGDIVFVELPEVGAKFGKNEVFAAADRGGHLCFSAVGVRLYFL